jgi:hypothetical protein
MMQIGVIGVAYTLMHIGVEVTRAVYATVRQSQLCLSIANGHANPEAQSKRGAATNEACCANQAPCQIEAEGAHVRVILDCVHSGEQVRKANGKCFCLMQFRVSNNMMQPPSGSVFGWMLGGVCV